MPPSRADRSLLLVTGSLVIAAGVFAALIIFLLTGTSTPQKGPLPLGLAKTKRAEIRADGPQYVANPYGGDGFWLDLEHGRLVALVLDTPGPGHCVAKWKAPRHAYVDCHDRDLSSLDLDRYEVIVGSLHGSPKGYVFVDVRKVANAPGPAVPPTTVTAS